MYIFYKIQHGFNCDNNHLSNGQPPVLLIFSYTQATMLAFGVSLFIFWKFCALLIVSI